MVASSSRTVMRRFGIIAAAGSRVGWLRAPAEVAPVVSVVFTSRRNRPGRLCWSAKAFRPSCLTNCSPQLGGLVSRPP